MKIYNEQKTKELVGNEVNLELGYLVPDKLFVAHHEATAEVKGKSALDKAKELLAEGKPVKEIRGKFYLVKKRFENGGEKVKEIAADPDTPAKEAYDEEEDIQVYIPYTEEELTKRSNQREISELKTKLSETDYQAIKYAEGEISEEAYAKIKAQRRSWRARINELEALL